MKNRREIYTLGSNQYSLMTFLAQAARLALDHLCTAWSVCKIQTLKAARLRLICRWVWCLMHRNTFTLTGPVKTVRCWLCSLAGTNPSVSPRRSGQLSDRVPALLCKPPDVKRVCLISQQAPVLLSAWRLIHLMRTTKETMLAAQLQVAAFAVILQDNKLWKHLQVCKSPAASPETKSTLIWQALWGRRSWTEALVVLLGFYWEATRKGQKSGRVKGSLQVNTQRLSFTV